MSSVLCEDFRRHRRLNKYKAPRAVLLALRGNRVSGAVEHSMPSKSHPDRACTPNEVRNREGYLTRLFDGSGNFPDLSFCIKGFDKNIRRGRRLSKSYAPRAVLLALRGNRVSGAVEHFITCDCNPDHACTPNKVRSREGPLTRLLDGSGNFPDLSFCIKGSRQKYPPGTASEQLKN